MNNQSVKSMNQLQAELYESPRVEVVELEIEESLLVGVTSMPYDDF